MRRNSSLTRVAFAVCAALVVTLVTPVSAQTLGDFQVEVFAGYAEISPFDLNRAIAHEKAMQDFLYSQKYQWLSMIGYVQSWDHVRTGRLEELREATPIGARVKYSINEWLAVSLGYTEFSETERGSMLDEYSSVPFPDFRDLERITTAPFALEVEASIPQLGVHVSRDLTETIGLELYLLAGAMQVDIRYEHGHTYEWISYDGGTELPLYEEQSHRVETGDGDGLSLELGARVDFKLGKRWGVFVEGGYAYQVADDFSGSGYETRNGETVTWSGDWYTYRTQIDAVWGDFTSWGDHVFEYPSSYEDPASTHLPPLDYQLDFEIDLSGLQARIGVVFRF